jgi:hypothetical protein
MARTLAELATLSLCFSVAAAAVRAAVAATTLASSTAEPAPAQCSFAHNLTNLQCQNMRHNKAATPALCRQVCCSMRGEALAKTCSAWNFSPDGGPASCSLWVDSGSVPKCGPPAGTWKLWVGGADEFVPTRPPPAPPGPPIPSPPPPPAPAPAPPPAPPVSSSITLDAAAFGPALAGIGAISGGGATSRLLVDYPEPQRTQVLDMMFKPYSGAQLQVLKVEIGGGAFTSDGAEASHRYTADDTRSPVRFQRGYEWWLMAEAHQRNPAIVFYGLPWSWPAWVGGGKGSPWSNKSLAVEYIVDWVRGAKRVHGLDIGWIGDWNESPPDWDYNILLRSALDAAGFPGTKIAASDQGNGWLVPANFNATQLAAVDALAAHLGLGRIVALCHRASTLHRIS